MCSPQVVRGTKRSRPNMVKVTHFVYDMYLKRQSILTKLYQTTECNLVAVTIIPKHVP